MNYMITLQYEGTKYAGWQKQGNTDNTIQGKLEAVLSKMTGEDIEVFGSGRTDEGVHALKQIANFHTDMETTDSEIRNYLNRYLPDDIAVIDVTEADERFHSRLNAKSKIYCYRIGKANAKNIFERKFIYQYEKKLDVAKMQKAAKLLVGTHDFKSFCNNKKMKKSTVRTLYSVTVQDMKGEIKIYLHGDGFLYNMVRIIVGTLIEIGQGEREAEEITKIIEAASREEAGFTAPSKGLTLMDVQY